MGKTDRAMDFVHLDPGSEFAAWVMTYVSLEEGKVPEARKGAMNIGKASTYHRELNVACTQAEKPADIDKIARDAESSVMREAPGARKHRVVLIS
jgi:hypothetical protein